MLPGLPVSYPEPSSKSSDAMPQDVPDSHLCNMCNMDFLELCDLVAHRKMCSAAMAAVTRKRTITYDDEDKENLMSQPPNKKMIMNGEFSDGEDGYDGASDVMSEGEEDLMSVRHSGSVLSGPLARFAADKLANLEERRRSSESESIDDDIDENESSKLKDSSSSLAQQLNMQGASVFTDSNVKLERLDSTKVAVAQFAENNFPPNDLAMLLYSLQQQQLMQLQLLQQLQSQLAAGITPSLQNLPAMLLPGASALLAPMTGSPLLGNMPPSHMVSPPTNGVASISSTPTIYSTSKTSSKSVITSVTNSNHNTNHHSDVSKKSSNDDAESHSDGKHSTLVLFKFSHCSYTFR